ncbi:MAG: 8-amino-7-oxononanoate synthase [Candidatus Electrothrix sp. AR3]|nr:8-amino-7-oxononanoate synthase [Candidatus Electrothrix sp. AR3]
MKHFNNRLHNHLHKLDEQGLRRSLIPVQPLEQGRIQVGQQEYLNLAGNDYLGLANNPALIQAFYTELAPATLLSQYGLGSGASRLMTGNHDQYRQLEERLAQLYQRERALLFNSGFQLNSGILPALSQKGDLILADKFCHASLIDGMRLSPAKAIRYPHLDYQCLEELLQQHCQGKKTVFIVTESIFSMDGDCADLKILVELKEKYGAILYLDEAHAVGVRGQQGLGLAEEQGLVEHIDLLIGTFGKAWAGQGAFVLCTQTIADFLLNTARSLIFTTGLPPVSIHWLNFILPKVKAMVKERQRLVELSHGVRNQLQAEGLRTDGASHIVPVLIGEAAQAVAVAEQLRQQGFWVQAVRPPTVPPHTARLRLSVNAAMKQEQLAPLAENIARSMQP